MVSARRRECIHAPGRRRQGSGTARRGRRPLRPAVRAAARRLPGQLRRTRRARRGGLRHGRRPCRRGPLRRLGRPGARPPLATGHAGERVLGRQGPGRRLHSPPDRPGQARPRHDGHRLLAGVRRREQGRDHRPPVTLPPGRAARRPPPATPGRHAGLAGHDHRPGRTGPLVAARHRPRLPRQHLRLPGRRGDPPHHRHHGRKTASRRDRRPARRRRAHRPARLRAQTRRHVHLARPAARRGRTTRARTRPADGAQLVLQPGRPVRFRRGQHTPVASRGMPVHQRARHRPRRRPRLRRPDQPNGHRRPRRPERSHRRAGVRPGPGAAPAVPLRPRLPAHPARTAHRPGPGDVRPLRRPAVRSASPTPRTGSPSAT